MKYRIVEEVNALGVSKFSGYILRRNWYGKYVWVGTTSAYYTSTAEDIRNHIKKTYGSTTTKIIEEGDV